MFVLLPISSTNDFQPTLSLLSPQVLQPLLTSKVRNQGCPKSHRPEAGLPWGKQEEASAGCPPALWRG